MMWMYRSAIILSKKRDCKWNYRQNIVMCKKCDANIVNAWRLVTIHCVKYTPPFDLLPTMLAAMQWTMISDLNVERL